MKGYPPRFVGQGKAFPGGEGSGMAGVPCRQGGVNLAELWNNPVPVGEGLGQGRCDAADCLAQAQVRADHQQGAAGPGRIETGELHAPLPCHEAPKGETQCLRAVLPRQAVCGGAPGVEEMLDRWDSSGTIDLSIKNLLSLGSSIVWKIFNLNELKSKVAGNQPSIFEFLRSSQMSCALYRLPVGAKDMQAPHLEDELYLVLEGRAVLSIDGQQQEVGPGMVLFVGATTEHSFFNITEDLTLMAMFGPAGGMR